MYSNLLSLMLMKGVWKDSTYGSMRSTWILVALGDSTPTGYGIDYESSYVYLYACYLEEDLNVDVVVRNWATNKTSTVSDWVHEVQNNRDLRMDLRKARVVTLWLGWHNVIPCIMEERGDSGPIFLNKPDTESLQRAIYPMREGFDMLLREISSLTRNEALILIADVGIPPLFVTKWKEFGSFDLWYKQAYEVWRKYIIQAARKYNVHVVPSHKIVNDPHKDDILPAKYVQPDGLHFNELGHKLIADAHRKIGYMDSGHM